MSLDTTVKELSTKITEGAVILTALDSYWNGAQPAAFLSPEARDALGNRLRTLSVNFPRLSVTAKADRLTVTGFRRHGEDTPDPEVWAAWRRNGMEDGSAQGMTDALVYGRSFITVWANASGQPLVTVESPRNMAVLRDPATRQVVAAMKRWAGADGKANAVIYTADGIIRLTHNTNVVSGVFPDTGWTVAETIENPLGVVPVVPLVNRGRLAEIDGVSEMADVIDLSDALNKLMADAMVTSEFFARPRRWATGLELVEDDEGNVVNPFPKEGNRLWQSEDPATKFGQFDGARLDGYGDLTATVTQQIGALSGLPAHYLGLNGDQPPSADAIRSAEASLVSRAYSLQRTFGMAWAEVARLIKAILTGTDPALWDYETTWANPETRTPAQAADAAVKLRSVGMPLSVLLEDTLGMRPEQIGRVREAIRAEALDSAGVDLAALAQ